MIAILCFVLIGLTVACIAAGLAWCSRCPVCHPGGDRPRRCGPPAVLPR